MSSEPLLSIRAFPCRSPRLGLMPARVPVLGGFLGRSQALGWGEGAASEFGSSGLHLSEVGLLPLPLDVEPLWWGGQVHRGSRAALPPGNGGLPWRGGPCLRPSRSLGRGVPVASALIPRRLEGSVMCAPPVGRPEAPPGPVRPTSSLLLSQVQVAPQRPLPEVLRLPPLRCLSLIGLLPPTLAAAQLLRGRGPDSRGTGTGDPGPTPGLPSRATP